MTDFFNPHLTSPKFWGRNLNRQTHFDSIVGIFCFLVWVPLAVGVENNSLPPYKKMLDQPTDFSGVKDRPSPGENLPDIPIGFFAPHQASDPAGAAMWKGATLAIDQANARENQSQRPFRLIARWTDNPWAAGSKEMIRLVYEDQAWAVIGSVDGEATHVAEQIVTKCRLPLLSPVCTDPTLSYIRIPWIFRLPPDDRAQAKLLVEAGIRARGIRRVGLITGLNHDGRIAAKEFQEALNRNELNPVFHLNITSATESFSEVARKAKSFSPEALLLGLPRQNVSRLMDSLADSGFSCPVFIPWIPGLGVSTTGDKYAGEIITVQPFAEDEQRPAFREFARSYRQRFGEPPDAGSAYAYDAVNLVIQGIRRAGLNRARLRDALANLSGYEGVTGRVVWDNGGGNPGQPTLRVMNRKQ